MELLTPRCCHFLDLLTFHPIVCYIPSMFRQFVSARTHRATTCLFAYVCVFICMQSIKSNQIKSNQIKSNQIKSNQIKSNQINQIHRMVCLLVLSLSTEYSTMYNGAFGGMGGGGGGGGGGGVRSRKHC